jgi:hypothetical protein
MGLWVLFLIVALAITAWRASASRKQVLALAALLTIPVAIEVVNISLLGEAIGIARACVGLCVTLELRGFHALKGAVFALTVYILCYPIDRAFNNEYELRMFQFSPIYGPSPGRA